MKEHELNLLNENEQLKLLRSSCAFCPYYTDNKKLQKENEKLKLGIERALKTIEEYKEQISCDVPDRIIQLLLYSMLNDIIRDLS